MTISLERIYGAYKAALDSADDATKRMLSTQVHGESPEWRDAMIIAGAAYNTLAICERLDVLIERSNHANKD